MNAVLQLSRQELDKSIEAKGTWLSKRTYAVSQGIVDDLLAHVASLYSKIMPEYLDEIMLLADESFRTVSPLSVEYRIQHQRNGEQWLCANFMPDTQENGSVLWHGFIKEITEYKQALAQKGKFFTILEESVDYVGSVDLQGNLLYHNRAALTAVPDKISHIKQPHLR